MLLIETPDTRLSERDYILDVVLNEFLGLSWRRVSAYRTDVRITLQGQPGCVLLPDILFCVPEENWLTPFSMPKRPLSHWNSGELQRPANLVDPVLPVIYGDQEPTFQRNNQTIRLPIDIFGSAFFMLSRYEELVTNDRDEHDRFPAWASLAYREGFLERPIVDEYVELLWLVLYMLWPQLQRKHRAFRVRVSHDVDRPSRYQYGSTYRFLRALGGDILKRGNLRSAWRAPLIRLSSRQRLHPADPFNTFDWIMDQSEEHGLRSAFYFICGRTHPKRDALYDPGDPAIRALMRRISERGHEIGLHPSYNSYLCPERLKAEAQRLKRICDEEAIEQKGWGGRMHYLRWRQPITLRAWEQAGMDYDCTLGYADHQGFRCGTCQEYTAYDSEVRRVLRISIRPLVIMECTVLGNMYMGLRNKEMAQRKMLELRSRCQMFNGIFTLLWHNSELFYSNQRNIYNSVINA